MRFLCDENLYNPIVDYLRSEGHEVLNIKESEYAGEPDNRIYEIACERKDIIISMDKDFTRILRFPPIKEDDITQNLVVINPDGIRIKRLRE